MADSFPNAGQIDVLLQVTRILETLGIQYFIGGSLASNVYGFYRATADADIVAALLPSQADALAAALHPNFYADAEALRTAATTKTSFNVIHFPLGHHIQSGRFRGQTGGFSCFPVSPPSTQTDRHK